MLSAERTPTQNSADSAQRIETVTIMPKMKTHKSIRKRFRVTATGKLKRRQAGKKHLLSHKTGKRKRQLRRSITETTKIARTYVRMMGEV